MAPLFFMILSMDILSGLLELFILMFVNFYGIILSQFLLQMWMSVLKALTTATLMLTALTLLEVSSAHVGLVTPEMGLKTAQVREKSISCVPS